MKSNLFFLFFLGTFLLGAQNKNTLREGIDFKKGEVIIKLKNTSESNNRNLQDTSKTGILKIDAVFKNLGNYKLERINNLLNKKVVGKKNRPNLNNIVILKYESNANINQIIQDLIDTGEVEYAEPNYIGQSDSVHYEEELNELIPDDYKTSSGWWAKNNGTFTGFRPSAPDPIVNADTKATLAWNITTGSPNVTLAFLDSGIDFTNMEFAGRLLKGYDFVNDDDEPIDDESHGTNVTGLATMTGNNGFGLVGVDWKCKIMPVKVLNANNGFTNVLDFSEGLIFAVDNGADIANMSLSFNNPANFIQDAIEYAYDNGVVLIASMGNSDGLVSRWPAAYPQTIAVGEKDLNDWRVRRQYTGNSWGSNYGNHIDLVAPGNWMQSARHDDNQAFGYWKGGTSQATPLVSGAVSLLLGIDSTLTIEEIRTILRSTTDDQVGDPSEDIVGFDMFHGAGRLNIYEAILLGSTLSTSDIDDIDNNEFIIYPNPTNSILNLSYNNDNIIETIRIYDILGHIVYSKEIDNSNINSLNINVNALSTGVYNIIAKTNKGNVSSKRFVKN